MKALVATDYGDHRFTRRDALRTATMLGALSGWAGETSAKAVVTVHPERPGVEIPADFLGISCEKSVLAENHFRPHNTALENLFRNLGGGVLRPGGARVESTYWSRTEVSPDANTKKRKTIGPLALDNLYAFAKESGWRVIHGLNLGANDPAMAADEAAYAMHAGGPTVLALEIGNEPDLYVEHNLRPAHYGYSQYRGEVEAYHRAILTKLPHAPLAGPATTRTCEWFPGFVADFKDRIALATSHLYPLSAKVTDPGSARFASIQNLLNAKTDEVWMPMIEEHQKASRAAGVPFRLGECNSASGGGTDGVSNVFASALWGADFLFDVAQRGVAGINFHGYFEDRGYTPFCYRDNHYVPHPIYYGMLLFHQAARGRIVPVECSTPINVTAHAALGDDRKLRVVIVNKDLSHSAVASVAPGSPRVKGEVVRLTAPSVASKEGVTLAGSAVSGDGTWTPRPGEPVQGINGRFEVSLPAASAALLVIEKV
jgi:hypothetical protein